MSEYTFGVVSITVIIILFIYAFSGTFFEAKHVLHTLITLSSTSSTRPDSASSSASSQVGSSPSPSHNSWSCS